MNAHQMPRPVKTLEQITRYSVPTHRAPIDLFLDGNEGKAPPASLLEEFVRLDPEQVRRYPNGSALEACLARRLGIAADQVVVTAGADEALDRACRAYLCPGRAMLLPTPTFEMLTRYGMLAGARIETVPWTTSSFPTEAVLARITVDTAMIAVVSPNNPTGAVARAVDLQRLSEAAPQAVLLVDLAYVEYADEDLTAVALDLPNALVFRTFSKAYGMAGLRVGYAAGQVGLVQPLRRAGSPYPVSAPSLVFAMARLQATDEMVAHVDLIRRERDRLTELLHRLGAVPSESQANFVYARFADAQWVRDVLAGLGIAVRVFTGREDSEGCLRITLPGDEASFQRLQHALQTALAPEALLLDMDGVMVDVSASYRAAILATGAEFGVTISAADVAAAKAGGDANNDWILTWRLVQAAGHPASLAEVIQVFERIYQGSGETPGLRRSERLLTDKVLLQELGRHLPLAIVTGRPRVDAERLLAEHGIGDCFRLLVCMEDGPAKPDPAPVHLALERLKVTTAWMVGDTVDDVRAARRAAVLPLGIPALGDDPLQAADLLLRAGAGRCLQSVSDLITLLSPVSMSKDVSGWMQ